jgi:hypothetical protein
VGEPAPIPIESRSTRCSEPEGGEPGAVGGGTGKSSGRVVHEPRGWPRVAAVVAVAGLVAGGVAWALLDGEPAPAGDEERASEPSVPPDDPQAETRSAFAEAILRFGEVHSFAYRGSVRAAASRPFGAGGSTVGDLAVEGAVLLQPALARQVAADARGRAEETLTSGTSVWTRTATTADALSAAPWRVRPSSMETARPLDMQVVARLITTAVDPRGEAPDAAGRRVIRATLPARGDGAGYTLPLTGADVLLSLTDAGDIGHIVVTWPPPDAQLVLDVELFAHNQPQDIAPPDRGPGGLRRTVPVGALAAGGIKPLELGRVPAGWRLTGAWVGSRPGSSANCSELNLVYADPHAGSGNYLWLRVRSERCGLVLDLAGEPRPLAVGSLQGSVVVSSSGTTGALFDGTTGIQFETDLPVDEVATLLASLRPFDPEAEPEPLAAVPSD